MCICTRVAHQAVGWRTPRGTMWASLRRQCRVRGAHARFRACADARGLCLSVVHAMAHLQRTTQFELCPAASPVFETGMELVSMDDDHGGGHRGSTISVAREAPGLGLVFGRGVSIQKPSTPPRLSPMTRPFLSSTACTGRCYSPSRKRASPTRACRKQHETCARRGMDGVGCATWSAHGASCDIATRSTCSPPWTRSRKACDIDRFAGPLAARPCIFACDAAAPVS